MELQILAVFLLALSSNLDNVGVGTSYGTRTINIPFSSNLLIAFVTTTGTYLSMTAGSQISYYISPNISNAIGALMIGGTGVWILIREFTRPYEDKSTEAERQVKMTSFASQSPLKRLFTVLDHPFLADTDFSGHIDMKEGFFLALALTLNNLSNGVGAGLLGLDVALMVALTAILSILTIWFGIAFGKYSGVHWFGKYSGAVSGSMLIALGVYEYFA